MVPSRGFMIAASQSTAADAQVGAWRCWANMGEGGMHGTGVLRHSARCVAASVLLLGQFLCQKYTAVLAFLASRAQCARTRNRNPLIIFTPHHHFKSARKIGTRHAAQGAARAPRRSVAGELAECHDRLGGTHRGDVLLAKTLRAGQARMSGGRQRERAARQQTG
jgi:hypothetical protein